MTACMNECADEQMWVKVIPGGGEGMKEDSEMVLSPVQGDKERHNRGRRV